jgi:TolB-like protein/Tfp pilus assembly protein PilF
MDVLKKPQKISKRTPRARQARVPLKSAVRIYRFDTFVLDQAERVLLRGGSPVALTPKVFDILSVLVESPGHLVTKATLMERVWPDAFVEEANLSVNIATLRKVLGQGPDGQPYIETVRKRGYRFVAGVQEVERESPQKVVKNEQETAVVVPRPSNFPAFQRFNSLAVLPFENESGDSDAEYLSDGLTESIINNFSHLKDFRVLGRNTVFRYKAKSTDPQKIGEELGVRSLLTGRILRLGDKVIIRAEVTDVKEGWQVWGEQYDRELADILAVQAEIAAEISKKLRPKLSADEERRITTRHTDNSVAYHLYLKGRYHWNKYANKGLSTAIDYFRKAIEEDPVYALAYVGLSDSYYRLSHLHLPASEAMPKARLAAEKALEIDETLAEAHTALGSVLMFYYWDWEGARRECLRGVELNPGSAITHQRLGMYFNLVGRLAEAVHEYEAALDLDPLSPAMFQGMGFEFFLMGEYERAIEQAEKALELDPTYGPALLLLGWVHKRRGDLSKAIDIIGRAMILDDSPLYLASLGQVYGLNGDQTKALAILDQLEKRSKSQYVSSYCRTVVYVGLNEMDLAFDWLEKALEERSEMVPFLRLGGECDNLRSDPRFNDLLRRCGLETERAKSVQM